MASHRNSFNSKKTVTLVAAVAVVGAVAYYGSQHPSDGEDAAGTIAPAKRYRGEQITSEDVQLGDQS